MPQVPNYVPVPSEQPQQIGLPKVSINTPAAAFGGTSAQALGQLGQAATQSGNELFARAYALQQLNDETEAKNADAQYTIEAGKLHATFASLQGKDRVNAYPKLQQDLEGLRQKIRGQLGSPISQRMYDSASLSMMGRTVYNAAGMAASAQRDYVNSGYEGQIQLSQVEAGNNWNNPTAFEQNIEKIRTNAEGLGIGKGWSTERVKAFSEDAVAKAWYQKITTRAITDPYGAWSEYQAHHDEIGAYRVQLERALEQRKSTMGSKIVTDMIAGGGDYASRAAMQESSGGIDLHSPTSSAEGIYGFTKGTWTQVRAANPDLGLPTSVAEASAAQQRKAFDAFTAGNKGVLEKAGVDTSMANLYMAHFLGAGGAVKFLQGMKDDSGQPATALVSPQAAAANRSIFYEADGTPRSAASVYTRLTARFLGPGPLTKDSPASWLSDAEKAATSIIKEVDPNNPGALPATLSSLSTRFHAVRSQAKMAETQDLLTLEQVVNGGGDPSKAVTDLHAITNNPVLSQTYFNLPPPMQDKLKSMVAANAREPSHETPQRALYAQRVLNTAVADRNEFLNFDAADAESKGLISTGGMKRIMGEQRKIRQGAEVASRHLAHALYIGKDYVKSAGLVADSDDYKQYVGMMNQWLNDQYEAKKAYPPDSEIRDKAAELTAHTGGHVFGMFGGQYGYEIPSDVGNELKSLYKGRYGTDPTAEQLGRLYQLTKSHPNWRQELRK